MIIQIYKCVAIAVINASVGEVCVCVGSGMASALSKVASK